MPCSTVFLAIILWAPSSYCKVQYVFEEVKPSIASHLHPPRKGTSFSPYKSAASSTTNFKSAGYESFSLNCPHVADARSKEAQLEVTWTLNDTIWLKIEDGHQKIYTKLTTFTKKTVSGKSALRVLLNNGRYFFDYNELSGEFSMEIRPVAVPEDVGVWQCHVTVKQKDDTHTLTSRSRVKYPHMHRHNPNEHEKLPVAAAQISGKRIFTVSRSTDDPGKLHPVDRARYFTRDDGGLVHISRDDIGQQSLVVFNRQAHIHRNRIIKHIADYDQSIEDDDDEEADTNTHQRSRTRSAGVRSHSSTRNMLIVTILLVTVTFL